MTTATAKTSQESSNKPTHIAYTTRQGREGEKAFWTACGAAWPHKDGKGYRIKLDAVPVNGVIELRVNEPKAANDQSGSMWDDMPDAEYP